MNPIKHYRAYLFPPITREAALEIASQTLAQSAASGSLICYGRNPNKFHIYASTPEPCWYVQVPWNDGHGVGVLRSSRVIMIGRQTGIIYYDGPAGDTR